MIAVRLSGDLEMMVVATPDYLQRFGTPSTPRDLLQHRCLNCRWPTDASVYRWEFERDGEQMQIAVNGPLMVNEPGMMPRIVADGAGIAYLFSHDIKDMVASGALVQLLPEWTPTFPGFYLYYPSRRQMAPALRAFLDFIAANGPVA